jgi:hypothetical protein
MFIRWRIAASWHASGGTAQVTAREDLGPWSGLKNPMSSILWRPIMQHNEININTDSPSTIDENIMLTSALKYADLGWSIIPIQPHDKKPYVEWKIFQEKRAKNGQIIEWWDTFPQTRIGIVTGEISDLLAVDFDGPDAKPLFEEKVCKLPDTLIQKTGRGFHAIFKYPAGKKGFKTDSNYKGLKGVDLKVNGGYILAAPSPYDSEKDYKWENGDPATQGLEKLSEMPDEMVEFFSKSSRPTRVYVKRPDLEGVDEGERDNEIYKYSKDLKKIGLTFEEAELLVLQKAKNCNPPFSETEALKCLKSAFKDKDSATHCANYIEELNNEHFVSMHGGKTFVFNEEYDAALDRNILTSSSFTHFRQFYSNELVITGYTDHGDPIRKQKGKAWLENLNRRQYKGIVLIPNGDRPGYYNLWKGWAIDPQEGDWSKLNEHIKTNVCDSNAELYDYVIKWLAFAVQHPDKPSQVALVMRGKKGVGKSILGTIFGKLFGQNFLQIFSSKHLIGNFNLHLRDCIFLFADEAFWAGDKRAESVLKGLITEPTLVIEGKGKDVVITKNMLHIMMASNSDWVAPASLDERRFCILDVGDRNIQDKGYFGAIMKQMKNGGYAAMLYDLQNMDLSDFDIRDVPDSEGLREQKIYSMDPIEKWWFQKLTDGYLPPADRKWGIVEKNAMYDDYVNTVGKTGVTHKQIATILGIRLQKLVPRHYPKTKKIMVEKGYWNAVKDEYVSNKKSVPHWEFPPLEECRGFFEEIANMKGHKWPEEPEVIIEKEKPEF